MRICPTTWPALIALAALAGCAGPEAVRNAQDNGARLDMAKMNAIDALARARGVEVIWLHMPRRESAAAGAPGAVPNAPAPPVGPNLPSDTVLPPAS